MKCEKIKKWISDEIDRGLSERNRKILGIHSAKCGSCRAYQKQLEKIQGEAKTLAAPALAPEYWKESVAKLKAKLETAEPGERKISHRPSPAFFPSFRWAWAGVASMLAVAAGLYVMLFNAKTSLDDYPFAFEDQVSNLYEKIGDNADLEKDFNSELQASIREHAGESDGEVRHLLYGDSFFLEILSDEEIELLDTALRKELKL